tara:strand:- start:78 stop:908 length:831 start_codon:yes stop_codon:yes gene_type:complete
MKNAIIYLLNDTDEDKKTFVDSFDLLYKNYLKENPCDVVCFHEPNFCEKEKDFLKNKYKDAGIILQEIVFDLPDYTEEIKSKILEYSPHPEKLWRDRGHKGFPMGYRHMCNFFAGGFINLKCLDKYKYIWRLDTDSFILEKINYNVFERMDSSNSLYGYINIQHDHIDAVKDLWETCENYFTKENKVFKSKDLHFRRVFYSNFEIFKMSWFKSKPYQDFYNYINSTGGIYINRWGDHAIRYLGLNSLEDKSKFLFFHDVCYKHGSVYNNKEIIDTY